VALTAAEVNRILSLRGKLRPGVPDKAPDPTEQRLHLDRLLARWNGHRLDSRDRRSR
jgi:hypothetical protein